MISFRHKDGAETCGISPSYAVSYYHSHLMGGHFFVDPYKENKRFKEIVVGPLGDIKEVPDPQGELNFEEARDAFSNSDAFELYCMDFLKRMESEGRILDLRYDS